MTNLPFFQVDAFADRPLTGNPAAVMPLDRWLDDPVLRTHHRRAKERDAERRAA